MPPRVASLVNEEVDGSFAVADGVVVVPVVGRDEASAVGVIKATHRWHSTLLGAEDVPPERLLCVAKAILSAIECGDGGAIGGLGSEAGVVLDLVEVRAAVVAACHVEKMMSGMYVALNCE